VIDVIAAEALAGDAIVRSAAAGDRAAFARLVADHHAQMARVAYVICGDPDMTRDAVQAAWVISWRRIGALREPAHVRAWLVAIAANEARRLAAQRRHIPIVDISEAVGRVDDAHPGMSADVADLEIVLRDLRPDERLLLALRYEAGLDSAEIARHLGLSPSGVRSRLSRIVERLRADLALSTEPNP
jgi:RNA polymerase sigma-70 factor (ECF subfamily)